MFGINGAATAFLFLEENHADALAWRALGTRTWLMRWITPLVASMLAVTTWAAALTNTPVLYMYRNERREKQYIEY